MKVNGINTIDQNQTSRTSQMAAGLAYILENEKISTGVIAGAVAACEKVFERMSTIDSFEKSNLAVTEGKKGKELITLLLEKKLINSLPKTVVSPFLIVGSATSLLLYQVNKMIKKVKYSDL